MPHDLRHTAASLAVSARANVKAVERMLAHAKASMTLDTYADLFDEYLDGVTNRLDEAIEEITLSPNVSRPQVGAESCWRAMEFREAHPLESFRNRSLTTARARARALDGGDQRLPADGIRVADRSGRCMPGGCARRGCACIRRPVLDLDRAC